MSRKKTGIKKKRSNACKAAAQASKVQTNKKAASQARNVKIIISREQMKGLAVAKESRPSHSSRSGEVVVSETEGLVDFVGIDVNRHIDANSEPPQSLDTIDGLDAVEETETAQEQFDHHDRAEITQQVATLGKRKRILNEIDEIGQERPDKRQRLNCESPFVAIRLDPNRINVDFTSANMGKPSELTNIVDSSLTQSLDSTLSPSAPIPVSAPSAVISAVGTVAQQNRPVEGICTDNGVDTEGADLAVIQTPWTDEIAPQEDLGHAAGSGHTAEVCIQGIVTNAANGDWPESIGPKKAIAPFCDGMAASEMALSSAVLPSPAIFSTSSQASFANFQHVQLLVGPQFNIFAADSQMINITQPSQNAGFTMYSAPNPWDTPSDSSIAVVTASNPTTTYDPPPPMSQEFAMDTQQASLCRADVNDQRLIDDDSGPETFEYQQDWFSNDSDDDSDEGRMGDQKNGKDACIYDQDSPLASLLTPPASPRAKRPARSVDWMAPIRHEEHAVVSRAEFEELKLEVRKIGSVVSAFHIKNAHAFATPQNTVRMHKQREAPAKKSPQMKTLKDDIRKHALRLLGVKTAKDPLPISPSKEEIAAFVDNHFGGPSLSNFRPDFNTTMKSSEWNQELVKVYVRSFRDTHRHHIQDDDFIQKEFDVHFKHLRTKYRLQLDKTAVFGRRRSARRMRRGTLFRSRMKGCLRFTQLDRFLAWVQLLGTDGMSEDESDHDNGAHTGTRVYRAKNVFWRSKSPEFLAFLEILDMLFMSTKFTDSGTPHAGNWPRIRIRDGRDPNYSSKAVCGLPANFYDSEFLGDLHANRPLLFEKLNIQPAIDLTIDKRIIEWARFYLPALSEGIPQTVTFPSSHSSMCPRSLPEVLHLISSIAPDDLDVDDE